MLSSSPSTQVLRTVQLASSPHSWEQTEASASSPGRNNWAFAQNWRRTEVSRERSTERRASLLADRNTRWNWPLWGGPAKVKLEVMQAWPLRLQSLCQYPVPPKRRPTSKSSLVMVNDGSGGGVAVGSGVRVGVAVGGAGVGVATRTGVAMGTREVGVGVIKTVGVDVGVIFVGVGTRAGVDVGGIDVGVDVGMGVVVGVAGAVGV